MILTYQQLLNELARLVESGSSGTLFIRSECNHAVTFTLEKGQITALYFGPRKGLKALPLILGISGGSCKFDSSGPSRPPQDLPSTAEILATLESRKTQSVSSAGHQAAPSPEVWNKNLQALQNVLTDHLGPIADLLYEEALVEQGGFCTSAEQFQHLANYLAQNIEPDQIDLFREQVSSILKNAATG